MRARSDLILRVLTLAKRWCGKVGFNINPSKSAIIPFRRRRSLPALRSMTFNGVEVARPEEIKYLGLILDSKLMLTKYVDCVVKATIALMVCKVN